MSELYLIRHGQASFGKENYDQLSPLGYQQSEQLGMAMSKISQPTLIVRGDLTRHAQTQDACLKGMDCEQELLGKNCEFTVTKAFNEFDHDNILAVAFPQYAERERLVHDMKQQPNPRKAFHKLYVESINRWISGRFDEEYAESYTQYEQRVMDGYQQLIAQSVGQSRIFIFTSGGPIGTCMKSVLGVSTEKSFRLNEMLANSSVTKIVFNQNGEHNLSFFNSYAHLEQNGISVTYR